MAQFVYGQFPNVLNSLEFEWLLNASVPTGGNIHLWSQDKKGNWIFNTTTPRPENLAIIHFVGSRDKNFNKYCSRVGCMYSLKNCESWERGEKLFLRGEDILRGEILENSGIREVIISGKMKKKISAYVKVKLFVHLTDLGQIGNIPPAPVNIGMFC
jgi:hypothetical protein